MKIIKTTAPFDIIVDKYPLFKVINPKLLKDVEEADFSDPDPHVVSAKMSSYGTDSKNISIITNWVYDLIVKYYFPRAHHTFHQLEYYNCWFVKYNLGEEIFSHHHIPSSFSFVYYVKTPQNSVPLIFTHSRKRIKAEEGAVAIFPGFVNHHVPKSRCDARIVLAGNLYLKHQFLSLQS